MKRRLLLNNALIFGLLLSAGSARAQTYEVLHSFTGNDGSGFTGDTDGANPEAPLIQGPDGYFYGTTVSGSAIDTCYLGTVFKMSPSADMEILHYFRLNVGDDGRSPKAGLFIGSDGKLYGTTPLSTSLCGGSEYGTVFRLSTSGAFSQLHLFLGPDGSTPIARMIQHTNGYFYGTTTLGGQFSRGTVFRMCLPEVGGPCQQGSFVAYQYPLGSGWTLGGLIQGTDGNLYGRAEGDGAFNFGTLFKMTPDGIFTTLHSFAGGDSDGATPRGDLIQATDGYFYGTTYGYGCAATCNWGTVFRMDTSGNITEVHRFNFTDGAFPRGSLLQAADGNLYGTTQAGGLFNFGTVFKLNLATGLLTTLHSFGSQPGDGIRPYAGLIQASDGSLYGTTREGGSKGKGTVFRLTMSPSLVKLEKFAATVHDGGVYLEWKTGLEADNLGFNVYRERAGQRERVNPETVAGSALLTGQARLQTGRTYSWWDKEIADCRSPSADCRNIQYWLEDIDLNGQSSWHGPVSPQLVGGTPPPRSDAAVLSRIATSHAPQASPPVERRALARLNPGQGPVQPVPAGGSAVKVSVRREDWYSLSLTELVAAGLNPNSDPDRLQMYVDGEQVPINVLTGDKDQLAAVQFYGTGLDAAYSDARAYRIVEGKKKGLRIKQVKADAHPSSARSFSYSVERKDRTIYFSSLRNGERENFFGSVVGREAITQLLALQHIDRSSTEQAQVELSLQGVTTIPHRVWVNVNGSFVGEVAFNGQQLKSASFSLPSSALREGDNEVQLAAQGGSADVSLIDYVRVSYPRTFTAESDQLRFLATAEAAITVDGFNSGAIRVFDVTNQDQVQQLVGKIEQGKNGYSITVAPAEEGERTLFAIAGQTAGAQALVSASVASDLKSRNHAANLVVITNRDFFSALEPLKKLRMSQGYKVEMVDVEAIYTQFSFGNKSPYAVRDFLLYARTNWKIAPQYVLLAGDASYDPKNYLGYGDWDIVSTKLIDTGLMETASDDWFADFNRDGVPEMAVGRLPARTKEEAESLVARIVGYEQSSRAAELTLVADANDGYDFEAANAKLRALVPGDIRVVEIDRGRMGTEAKAALLDAIKRGQRIVNYTGHGNVNGWRADLLTNADAALLTNQNHLAVFVMMTCLNGYFDDPGLNSLAEALMKSGPGGAVAVWASSGMTMPVEQALMNQEFYRQLFANRGIALGEAIKRAKATVSDGDVRRTWILIGDPTMKLR